VRVAYLGSPETAVPPLQALLEAGHDVALVVTQPDRKRGRGATLLPTPVKAVARARGIPVTDRVDDVLDASVDLGVVVAFGRLIKPHVLAKVPMVNLHFSLLPRWRGAAPVERALLAGDAETGVCLMEVVEELDAGGVYAVERVPIGAEETADELRARLAAIGSRLLVDALARGLDDPVPQEGEPTYASKIDPEELHLDWGRPAEQLVRVVRVGRAWTTFRGKRLRILRSRTVPAAAGAPGEIEGLVVAAGDGSGLELVQVQPEGRAPQPAAAWANGARPQPGERLGE
jgi:methionyl-tRNA formyltransferase